MLEFSIAIPSNPPEITILEILTSFEFILMTGDFEFPLKTDFTILIMFNDFSTLIATSLYVLPAKITVSPEFASSIIFWISLPDRLSLINVPATCETYIVLLLIILWLFESAYIVEIGYIPSSRLMSRNAKPSKLVNLV